MRGKTHAGVGAVAYIALCNKLGGFSYLGLLTVTVAALLPDIDHPKSTFNKFVLPIRNKKTKVTFYLSLSLIIFWYDTIVIGGEPVLKALSLVSIMAAFSTHRNGLSHSIFGMLLYSLIVGYVSLNYKIERLVDFFMIGYASHLLLDSMTKMGIPLFYPFRKKKFKFLFTISTNSKKGKIIEESIMILGLVYLIYKVPHLFN